MAVIDSIGFTPEAVGKHDASIRRRTLLVPCRSAPWRSLRIGTSGTYQGRAESCPADKCPVTLLTAGACAASGEHLVGLVDQVVQIGVALLAEHPADAG